MHFVADMKDLSQRRLGPTCRWAYGPNEDDRLAGSIGEVLQVPQTVCTVHTISGYRLSRGILFGLASSRDGDQSAPPSISEAT